MLRKVELLGALGKKFGKEYEFDVSSAQEAFTALCSQVEGFRAYFESGEGSQEHYKILVNGNELTNPREELTMLSQGDIQIAPVVDGAGGNIGNAILGGILAVSALGFGPLGGLFVGEFAALSSVAPVAVGVGALLVSKGVAGMAFKPPETPAVKESKNERSYLFNGAVNTVQQGQPIPIGYGRLRVGSQVVSVSVSNAQVPV